MLKLRKVPWGQMMTSPPLLVTFVSNFAAAVMATTLQAYLPSYFKESLRLNLSAHGLLSAVPFLAQAFGKVVSASIADRLRSSGVISPTWISEIFNTIGTCGCSLFLMAAAYMTCTEQGEAILFLCISSALFLFQTPGFLSALLSMAPAYTGIVNSISRFFGQIGSVVAPLMVGGMTRMGTAEEWRNVFWLISGLMLLGGLLFLVFGSADLQPWAKKRSKVSDQMGAKDSSDS